MTTQVQDDGFHEIQLNGKQLVFLFMAATVVSVVIFLCGVLVGRGVKAERSVATPSDTAAVDVTEPPPSAALAPATSNDLSATKPPVPDDQQFTYTKRLEDNNKKETLKPPAPARAADTPPAQTVQPHAAQPPPAAVPAPKPVAAAPKEPVAVAPKEAVAAAPKEKESAVPPPSAPPARGDGYAIQVAALRESGEADVIAKRLVSKGYDAYVLTPPGGTPNVYRVRVGSFKTRRDAEAIASKLQQEEQFKPWITR